MNNQREGALFEMLCKKSSELGGRRHQHLRFPLAVPLTTMSDRRHHSEIPSLATTKSQHASGPLVNALFPHAVLRYRVSRVTSM